MSICPPLPNALLRTLLYVRYLSRIWSTVCRPSPQSHPGSSTSGTLLFHRKSLSPIFSVRIWMSRALCHFFRPWYSRRTLCNGCGVCLNVVLPLVSAFQLFIHSALVCLLIQVFKVACKWYVLVLVALSVPWPAPAFCLAALLAALSAASFPRRVRRSARQSTPPQNHVLPNPLGTRPSGYKRSQISGPDPFPGHYREGGISNHHLNASNESCRTRRHHKSSPPYCHCPNSPPPHKNI
jgi:hypothetical protein